MIDRMIDLDVEGSKLKVQSSKLNEGETGEWEGVGSEYLKELRERREKVEGSKFKVEGSRLEEGEGEFRPTNETWGLVRSAFEGDDPLSFVSDAERRRQIRFWTKLTENPKETEQSWALAAYYSQVYRKDIRFCRENLQALNEKWFEKEGISVEEAFAGIQRSYRGEIDWSGSLGAMWDDTQALAKAMTGKVMKTFTNAFYAGLKTATTDPAALAAYTDPEGLAMMNPLVLSDEGKEAYDENVREGSELVDQMHRDVRKYWGGMAEENSAKVLDEDWFYKWDGGMWLANLDRFLLMEAPSQAVQIYAAYVMGPLGFTLAMGGSSGLDKYYDLEDSGLPEEQRVKNAMLTGLINSGAAWITAGVVKGKIPGLKKEALLKGNREIVNYFVKAFGIEASQEAVEQLAENATDIYTGVYGDVEQMSREEYYKHLWNGVPESALAGGFFGLGAGTVGYRSAREFAGAVEFVDRKARGTVTELEKKETLTDKEAKQLERAKLIVECENPGKKLVLERMNELAFAAEEVEEIPQSEEFKRIMETAEEGTTEEMVIQSILAERQKQIRDMATWNYQDTVDEVEKFAEGIKGTTFHVYFTDQGGSSYGKDTAGETAGSGNTRNTGNIRLRQGFHLRQGYGGQAGGQAGENAGSEAAARESGQKQKPVGIPDEVWRYMKRKGIENARAFYYKGEVYLNGDRVRPSEVREVLTHEVVGHKGLRAIVGEKRLNELLDEVYREHYQDELFQEVAKRYKLGQEVEGSRSKVEGGDPASQDGEAAASAGSGNTRNTRSTREGAGTDGVGEMTDGAAAQAASSDARSAMEDMPSSAEATEDMEDEYAASPKLWYSVDDEVNQRIAAEEYLAHLAESGKAKPSWWREFLQKVRMALSRVHLFRDVKMSDREIETLLARSARAMRKRMLSRRSQVRYEVGERRDERGSYSAKATEDRGGSDPRFSIGESDERGEKKPLEKVRAQTMGTKAWMRAPNGEHTRLNEDQWCTVHTAEFKRYYGDWESAALLNNAEKAWNDDDFTFTYNFPASERLKNKLESIFQHPVKTLQIDGGTVRHTKNHHGKNEKPKGQIDQTVEDIVTLPYLLNNFDDAFRDPEHDDKKGNRAVTILKRVNGVSVIGTIERGKDGVYVVTKWEKIRTSAALMSRAPELNVRDDADILNVQREIEKNKRSAKEFHGIVDENGEPLVVYRGAEFDPLAQEPGKGIIRPEAYFTADPEYAKRYARNGGEVREYYLNIRRPFDIRDPECLKDLQSVYPDHEFQRGKSGALDWGEASIVDGEFLKENFGDKYDGIIYDEGGDQTDNGPKHRGISYVPLDGGTQVKSATDNIGTFDPKNPDVRFMLSDYSEADIRDIVAILRPFAGTFVTKKASEYAQYLAEHGVKDIPEKDALSFAMEAKRINDKERRIRGYRKREEWLSAEFPLYGAVTDITGTSDFVIRPSHAFEGKKFTGTFISPEFRKYSEKRPQGAKESDESYYKYLVTRAEKLKKAQGWHSDELAKQVARKWNMNDEGGLEENILEFFKDLKKPDLYHVYKEYRDKEFALSKEERERMFDEYMRQEQARAEEEALEVLRKGEPITQEWIEENRMAYEALYRMIYDTGSSDAGSKNTRNTGNTMEGAADGDSRREAGDAEAGGEKKDKMRVPYPPSARRLEELNAMLAMKNPEKTAEIAEAYRNARIASWREYMEALRKLRDKVMQSKADAIRLQRDALDFAEKYLRPDERWEFARDIVRLLEYSTEKKGKYLEGRRMFEFQALLKRMTERAGDVRKASRLAEIREMLDAVKVKRNYKGIPTSVLPSEQGRVDRIRQIVEMNLAALSNMIVYNNEQIELLEDDPEKLGIREKYLEDNALLEMFGNLAARSADEVEAAAKELKKLIEGGKLEYREKLKQRKAELEEWQRQAVQDATFGKGSYKERGDAKGHSGYWLKNENLGTLMRLVSGGSMQDFDKSVHGALYRNVEDSTQKEQTALRRMQQDLDEALGMLAGVTGKTAVERMRKKGKFYRMVSEVVEHSGVFKKEYSRMTKLNVVEEGRRALEKSSIPVEDYEWQGKMYPGARSLLREIDNGGKASWHGRPLDEMAVAFLRQQLADYDTGLKNSYEIFHDEADDANFNRMLEEERESGRLMVIHPLAEEYSETVEVPLSQGQALQILLTWEQKDYQANMKWNGWTEESIKQLRAFIKPEVLKMGYWMRDYIAQKKAELDAKVFERYGAHLPLNEKYFPGAFRGSRAKKVKVESELGRGAGSLSINPNFLIARKFHLNPVDTEADAFSSFLGNQIEQEHFLAWSDTIRDLKGVYGSSAVQKAISDNFGRAVADNLVERISTIAAGGGKYNGEFAARMFGKLYRYWVPAKIALNGSSVLKQIFGSAAYMNRVPVRDFVVNMSKANFANREYRDFVRWAKDTDYMKNRLAGGLDKDLQFLLNYTRDSHAYSPFTDALMQAGTWQTRWADKWSALHGGFAAYQYALKQARKSGMTESEAIGAARRAWMRWTDETQQSGYFKDQNYFQANQGAWRYLTAFMSNPIQVMNLQLQTMNEIRYGKNKKAAWGKLGRQIVVNHLVVPTLMQFATDMIRHGFDVPEWWDEAEFGDYLLAWGLGSFEAAFLYGKLLQSLVQSTYKWSKGFVAIPLLEDLEQDVSSTKRMVTTEKELTEKELMEGIKTAGDVGMLLGTADSRIGAVGGVLSALGAQGKRIVRWFEEER